MGTLASYGSAPNLSKVGLQKQPSTSAGLQKQPSTSSGLPSPLQLAMAAQQAKRMADMQVGSLLEL